MIRVLVAGLLAAASLQAPVLAATGGYRLAALDGSGWIDSRDRAGRASIVVGWADWCAPCVAETPRLAGLAKRHPELELVVAAVAPNQRARTRLKVLEGTSVRLAKAPLDSEGWMRRLGNPSAALPYAARFDRDGRRCATTMAILDDAVLAAMERACRDRSSD